jgi:hypothetical protein
MERAITARHHGLGRILAKAVLRGRHGAAVKMADIGRKEKRVQDGLPARLGSSVPTYLLPKGLTEKQARDARQMKPDLLLVRKDKKSGSRLVQIVEFKYCKDTDPTNQEQRARQQHRKLAKLPKQKLAEQSANY